MLRARKTSRDQLIVKRVAVLGLVSVLILLEGIALAQSAPPPATAPTADPAADKDLALIEARCTMCHEVGQVTSMHKNEAEWVETVDRMAGMGAEITPDEKTRILSYLKTHNGLPTP